MCKPNLAKSPVIQELPAACASEPAAVEFLEAKRWGDTPCCPLCGSVAVYKMTDRATGERNARYLWRCRDCKKQYTVRTGTVYAESLIPLHKWVRALWEAGACKNGVSALEMSRKIEVSYKTALFLMHRIRWAMADDYTNPPKMTGTVESDETYIGGQPRSHEKGWKHGAQKQPRDKFNQKQPVTAIVQRGGTVRTKIVANVTKDTVLSFLTENVSPSARIMTDSASRLKFVGANFAGQGRVNHYKGEYVKRGTDIHTQTVESFFSRVKRGLAGTYHAVSPEHLHRYMAQFEFAHNYRQLNDGDRILALIAKTQGKRLPARTSTPIAG